MRLHLKQFAFIFTRKNLHVKRIIHTGIIGFGVGGNIFHAPIIHTTEGLNIYKIRARKESEVDLAKHRYHNALITDNVNDIINDPNIELIVIATPNDSHYPL